MAGEYLPPVVQKVTADISELLAKIEAAKAAIDDLEAKSAESQALNEGGGGGALGGARRDMRGAARDAEQMDKHLGVMRQLLHGQLQSGLQDLANNLKSVARSMQDVTGGIGQIFSGLGSLGGFFTGPLGILKSIVGFGAKWAVMLPTLMAAPALLGAIGGAAGGLAGSFTVLSTAVGLFALGAMKDLSLVTSVSNMAQFDALSAPLQRLYYAYHNLANAFTIMTQTMGQNTIIGVLTNMFNTLGTVLQRIGPLMGEVASAGQAAFNILSGSLLGPQFQQFINWIGAEATPVLTTFTQTFVNLASGWAGLMQDLTPAITLFDQGMVHLTQTFTNWANSPKGKSQVEGFISYIQKAWPDISKFWGGLGHILTEFFSSAAKDAPMLAAQLGGLFTTIGNAMPSLVKFADTVLPGIVHGFAQFTGGFFQGLSSGLHQFLTAISGGNHVNWHRIGETAGKLAADLLQVLPPLAKVLEMIVNLAHWLTTVVPGGLTTIIELWGAWRIAVAAGTIFGGLSKIASGLSGIYGMLGRVIGKWGVLNAMSQGGAAAGGEAAGAGAAGGEGATGLVGGGLLGAGALGSLAGAGILGVAGLGAFEVLTHTNQQNLAAAKNYATLQRQRFSGNVAGAARFGAGAFGSTPNQVSVQSHVALNVSGMMTPEALHEIEMQLEQHDQKLVNVLRQVRFAY